MRLAMTGLRLGKTYIRPSTTLITIASDQLKTTYDYIRLFTIVQTPFTTAAILAHMPAVAWGFRLGWGGLVKIFRRLYKVSL